jgi:hypothetical protein
MSNAKTPFIPNSWVKCIFEKKICLGRTFLENSTQLISLISESGDIATVPFSKVNSVVILKILTVQEFDKELGISKDFKSQGVLKFDLNQQLAIKQLKTSLS